MTVWEGKINGSENQWALRHGIEAQGGFFSCSCPWLHPRPPNLAPVRQRSLSPKGEGSWKANFFWIISADRKFCCNHFEYILEILAKRISNVNNHLPAQSHAFEGDTVDLITPELCKDLRGGWNFGQIIVVLCAADRSPCAFLSQSPLKAAEPSDTWKLPPSGGRVRDSCPINLLFYPVIRFF